MANIKMNKNKLNVTKKQMNAMAKTVFDQEFIKKEIRILEKD